MCLALPPGYYCLFLGCISFLSPGSFIESWVFKAQSRHHHADDSSSASRTELPTTLEGRCPGFQYWLFSLWHAWPWIRHLTSVALIHPWCSGVIIVSLYWNWEEKDSNAWKATVECLPPALQVVNEHYFLAVLISFFKKVLNYCFYVIFPFVCVLGGHSDMLHSVALQGWSWIHGPLLGYLNSWCSKRWSYKQESPHPALFYF